MLRKFLKNQGAASEAIVTDGLASYRAAMKFLGCPDCHLPGRLRDQNRVENSHLAVRRHERKNAAIRVPRPGPARFVTTVPRSTTRSTCSVISFPARRSASPELPPRRSETPRPPSRDKICEVKPQCALPQST